MEALIDEMLDGRILLGEALGEFEKIYIEKALERNGSCLIDTATALGVHRNTLSKRVHGYKEAKRNHKPARNVVGKKTVSKTKGRSR